MPGRSAEPQPARLRHLVLVLGDQLDRASPAFNGFDPAQDAVWMAEVSEESTHVWSAKQRSCVFLAAMRHFAQALRDEGVRLLYRELTNDLQDTPDCSLADALRSTLQTLQVQRVLAVEPGEWRLRDALQTAAAASGTVLELREDSHFLCSTAEFAAHAKGRRQLRMEYFYREMRRRHGVLMQADGNSPVGGAWNYDSDNRHAFGPDGPASCPSVKSSTRWTTRTPRATRRWRRWKVSSTGRYIQRMSDHCRGCRYKPDERVGPQACPFTTLYWDFLSRHAERLCKNPRMALQVKNLARIAPAEMAAIGQRAAAIRAGRNGH